jgi:hypothetical protein
MLSLSCRRFRMEFTPGADHPHRKSCAACAAYAAAMERAAKKAPLPSRLRSKLRAVPATQQGDAPRLLVPQAPLPGSLRERLQQVSRRREARPPLPAWVRSSRYALAASYLLAVLVGAAIGNPVEAAGTVSRSVDRAVRPRVEHALEGVEGQGLRQLDDLKSAVRERYGATRSILEQALGQALEQSLGSLETRVSELDNLRKSLFSLDRLTDWNEGD